MPTKRYATITDSTGKELYRGEDRRSYNQDYPKCHFGIPIIDWIKGILFIGSCLIGFGTMLNNQKQMIEDNKVFHQFITNNDNWNTSVYKRRFNLGQPIDNTFNGNQ